MYLASSKTCRRFHSLHSLLYLKIMLMDKISFFVVDCGCPRLGRGLFIHFPSILLLYGIFFSFFPLELSMFVPDCLSFCMYDIMVFYVILLWFFNQSLFFYFTKTLITPLAKIFCLRIWWHSINLYNTSSSFCDKGMHRAIKYMTSLIDTVLR